MAERAHLLWNNKHIRDFIIPNRQIILPIVIPALELNTKNHWNRSVLNLTLNLKKMLYEMDSELVAPCQGTSEENSTKPSNDSSNNEMHVLELPESDANSQSIIVKSTALVEPLSC